MIHALYASSNTVLKCYFLKKTTTDVDLFVDYPGKVILDINPLAMYKDIDEARFHCILNAKCTGISSLANEHFLASGIEMVGGLSIHVFRLKTSKDLLHTF